MVENCYAARMIAISFFLLSARQIVLLPRLLFSSETVLTVITKRTQIVHCALCVVIVLCALCFVQCALCVVRCAVCELSLLSLLCIVIFGLLETLL